MKKKVLFIVLSTLGLSPFCFGDEAYQARLVEKSLLLDIAATDFLVAVGERGHVITSVDGDTFSQQAVPTQSTLTAVSIVGNSVWAAGHDATILFSADGGKQWEIQYQAPELERPFLDILFFDSQHGIAVGAYGLFVRTDDGGKTWHKELHAELLDPMDLEYLESVREENEDFYQQELNSILPHLNRVTWHNDKLYLAGEAGTLAVSQDQGKTWEPYDMPYAGSFFDITLTPNGDLVAAGLRGNIFRLTDNSQWESIATCNTATLNSIFTTLPDSLVILGNNGTIISLDYPLHSQPYDPYSNPDRCEAVPGATVSHTADKSAIINAVSFNNKVIAVTADGIHNLQLDK